MQLTLITPYRNRLNHLTNQLAWWQQYSYRHLLEWIAIEVSSEPSTVLQKLLAAHGVSYLHLVCPGPFHKTKALNLGLQQATGDLIAAFDVDLIPLGNSLARHCQLALKYPDLLVTGYRLMAHTETVDLTRLESALEQATLGPEDQPTALRKHLLRGERFGVMPLFRRDRLLAFGGWDEAYIGWGAEDQDLIERYLTPEHMFCRSCDLIYLHLKHGPVAGWNCEALTANNRAHYYSAQQLRKSEL
jgi:hypothetical protein